MSSYAAPTDKQVNFALALAGERVAPELGDDAEARRAELRRWLDERRVDRYGLMGVIDVLKAAPRDVAVESGEALTPGVYERNGEVFVVKPNRAGTNLYAKRMVEITGRRLNANDDRVAIEFEYAPGAIRSLRPTDRMPLDRAKELTLRYGKCINCGRVLRDAKSVERGIGPVCVKAFR